MPHKIEADFTQTTINIGINEKDRKAICRSLSVFLADSYLLYLKTQNYHWNVTGKMFHSLHVLFENQYKELAMAIDVMAERIRALGEFAPGTFSAFCKLSTIKEEASIPTATEMIHFLVEGNETVISKAREIIQKANECEDDVTAGLMVERMQIHEKNAWMLRSLIASQNSH